MIREKVSFIIPTRNNLSYLKLCYESIKLNAPDDAILILDDNSSDETPEWIKYKEKDDTNLLYYFFKNDTNSPLGHTILYNIGVEKTKTSIISILHADMIISKSYVENCLKHLEPKTIVSATRIEPPLHPSGKEKIQRPFGEYSETFERESFTREVKEIQKLSENQITKGFFAPWFMYKKDYIELGGMDELFAPYPYEDSDFAQRAILNKFNLIQSRDSLVYHFTCRGHKWTSKIGIVHSMFSVYEKNARRNFIRKWHSWIKNDEYCHPIIQHKYDIGIIIETKINNFKIIEEIEPWCEELYILNDESATIDIIKIYIDEEQSKTKFDLSKKIFYINEKEPKNDIIIKIDLEKDSINNILQIFTLYGISNLVTETNDLGTFKIPYTNVGIIQINKIEPKEHENIKCYINSTRF